MKVSDGTTGLSIIKCSNAFHSIGIIKTIVVLSMANTNIKSIQVLTWWGTNFMITINLSHEGLTSSASDGLTCSFWTSRFLLHTYANVSESLPIPLTCVDFSIIGFYSSCNPDLTFQNILPLYIIISFQLRLLQRPRPNLDISKSFTFVYTKCHWQLIQRCRCTPSYS